jgi:DNA-binding NarL/FixJ family response regulator
VTVRRSPDPITPMWRGVLAFGVMAGWSVVSSFLYLRERTRPPALVVFDLVLTTALLLTSPWVLSDEQFLANVPLITTVWAAVPPVAAGARFGASGGVLAGLVVGVATGLAREKFDLDVARDGVLLAAAGLLVGMAATMGRRSAARLEQALRKEAATAERERLARSIHDSVLQVLARVRKRGNEVGGEAAELVDAVHRTAAGDPVFTAGLAGLVLGEYRRMADAPAEGAEPPRLTERETDVLRLVAKGLTARQIAERLVLSHRTVENHVQSTLRKLQLHNRVELARYAIEHGLDEE